jgi:hypothetical protein
MYLYIDEYVSRKNYSIKNVDGEPEDNEAFKTVASLLPSAKHIREHDWTGFFIKVPVGYWRKANAIHGWIVDNCANGVDECQEIYLSSEDLQNLYNSVVAVLEGKVLPSEASLEPRSGFFFGSTDMDDWYKGDLLYTRDLIKGLLDDPDVTSVTYQASW